MLKKVSKKSFENLKADFESTQNQSVGALIAILQKYNLALQDSDNLDTLSPKNRFRVLIGLVTRAQELETNSRLKNDIISGIPERTCNSADFFLANNPDFFLIYLDATKEDYFDGMLCKRLMKHLNDCFGCMEQLSNVIRDYHRQSEKYS